MSANIELRSVWMGAELKSIFSASNAGWVPALQFWNTPQYLRAAQWLDQIQNHSCEERMFCGPQACSRSPSLDGYPASYSTSPIYRVYRHPPAG